jgi:hypothetical protein
MHGRPFVIVVAGYVVASQANRAEILRIAQIAQLRWR